MRGVGLLPMRAAGTSRRATASVAAAGGMPARSLVDDLSAENERLRAEVEHLTQVLGEHEWQESGINMTTTAMPTVIIGGQKLSRLSYEKCMLGFAFVMMLFLWSLPRQLLFRTFCETRLNKVYPFITLANLLIFCVTLHKLTMISLHDVFFSAVALIEIVIDEAENATMGFAGIFGILVMWKFKDRVLEALGVENAQVLIGEVRDWATCWSMKRFHPIELFIWKLEGLPACRLHALNDIFCEVSLGYNVKMRTRVHTSAGHGCCLKESMQMNFDPFDTEFNLKLSIRNQELAWSNEIAGLQLSAKQVDRLKESMSEQEQLNRTLGWSSQSSRGDDRSVWSPERFLSFDLVPAGKIYVRFAPVLLDSSDGTSCCGLCGPRTSNDYTSGHLQVE